MVCRAFIGIWVACFTGCMLLPLEEVTESDTNAAVDGGLKADEPVAGGASGATGGASGATGGTSGATGGLLDAAGAGGEDDLTGGEAEQQTGGELSGDGSTGGEPSVVACPEPQVCTSGAARCGVGRARQVCIADKVTACLGWSEVATCEIGCVNGACCEHQCEEGATRCVDDRQEVCDYHGASPCLSWGEETDCRLGCADGTCVACREPGGTCDADSDCCGATDGRAQCFRGTCRRVCDLDDDCPVCCIPLLEGSRFLGRVCSGDVNECEEFLERPRGAPCGGASQCTSNLCSDVGACTEACVPRIIGNGCDNGLLGEMYCPFGVQQCVPRCTSDEDCIPFLRSKCEIDDGDEAGICAS